MAPVKTWLKTYCRSAGTLREGITTAPQSTRAAGTNEVLLVIKLIESGSFRRVCFELFEFTITRVPWSRSLSLDFNFQTLQFDIDSSQAGLGVLELTLLGAHEAGIGRDRFIDALQAAFDLMLELGA